MEGSGSLLKFFAVMVTSAAVYSRMKSYAFHSPTEQIANKLDKARAAIDQMEERLKADRNDMKNAREELNNLLNHLISKREK